MCGLWLPARPNVEFFVCLPPIDDVRRMFSTGRDSPVPTINKQLSKASLIRHLLYDGHLYALVRVKQDSTGVLSHVGAEGIHQRGCRTKGSPTSATMLALSAESARRLRTHAREADFLVRADLQKSRSPYS
jgi:hypothetical protein